MKRAIMNSQRIASALITCSFLTALLAPNIGHAEKANDQIYLSDLLSQPVQTATCDGAIDTLEKYGGRALNAASLFNPGRAIHEFIAHGGNPSDYFDNFKENLEEAKTFVGDATEYAVIKNPAGVVNIASELATILPDGKVSDFLERADQTVAKFSRSTVVGTIDSVEGDLTEIMEDSWKVLENIDDPEQMLEELGHWSQKYTPVGAMSLVFTSGDLKTGLALATRNLARQADLASTYLMRKPKLIGRLKKAKPNTFLGKLGTKKGMKKLSKRLRTINEQLEDAPAGSNSSALSLHKRQMKAALKEFLLTQVTSSVIDESEKIVNETRGSADKKAMAAVLGNMIAEIGIDRRDLPEHPLLTSQIRPKRVNVEWMGDDFKSGAWADMSGWHPIVEGVDDCISFGDTILGRRGDAPPTYAWCSLSGDEIWKGKDKWWSRPVDFAPVWNDSCSGGRHDRSIWLPVCKEGYVALGMVLGREGSTKPYPNRVACLKMDSRILQMGNGQKAGLEWEFNDEHSGSKIDVTVYKRWLYGQNLFWAVEGYPAKDDRQYVASLELPVKADPIDYSAIDAAEERILDAERAKRQRAEEAEEQRLAALSYKYKQYRKSVSARDRSCMLQDELNQRSKESNSLLKTLSINNHSLDDIYGYWIDNEGNHTGAYGQDDGPIFTINPGDTGFLQGRDGDFFYLANNRSECLGVIDMEYDAMTNTRVEYNIKTAGSIRQDIRQEANNDADILADQDAWEIEREEKFAQSRAKIAMQEAELQEALNQSQQRNRKAWLATTTGYGDRCADVKDYFSRGNEELIDRHFVNMSDEWLSVYFINHEGKEGDYDGRDAELFQIAPESSVKFKGRGLDNYVVRDNTSYCLGVVELTRSEHGDQVFWGQPTHAFVQDNSLLGNNDAAYGNFDYPNLTVFNQAAPDDWQWLAMRKKQKKDASDERTAKWQTQQDEIDAKEQARIEQAQQASREMYENRVRAGWQSCSMRGELQSRRSEQGTFVVLKNLGIAPLSIYWVNYQGNETDFSENPNIPIFILGDDDEREIQAGVGEVFIALDNNGNCVSLIEATSRAGEVFEMGASMDGNAPTARRDDFQSNSSRDSNENYRDDAGNQSRGGEDQQATTMAGQGCDLRHQIASQDGGYEAIVSMRNTGDQELSVYWVNYDGGETDYNYNPAPVLVLEPGQTQTFDTFERLVYVVTNNRGDCRGVLKVTQQASDVEYY